MAHLRQSDCGDATLSVLAPDAFAERAIMESSDTPEEPRLRTSTYQDPGLPQSTQSKSIVGPAWFLVAGPISSVWAQQEQGQENGGMPEILRRFGLPSYEADRCAARILGGRAFLSVRCGNYAQAVKVAELLEKAGATSIGAARHRRPERSAPPRRKSNSPTKYRRSQQS